MMGILLASFYIFKKAVKYPATLRLEVLAILWCAFWAFLSSAEFALLPLILFRPLISVLSIVYIFQLTKLKLATVVSAFLFSLGVSYSLYYAAALSVSFMYALLATRSISLYASGMPLYINQPVYLLLYAITTSCQLFFATRIFRIRRFRNGFPFLFERYAVVLALLSAGAILVLVTQLTITSASEDAYAALMFMAGILVIGVGICVWIKTGIKTFQIKRTKERNEELFQQEIAALKHELQQIKNNNEILRVANHSINHRMAAMLRINEKILQKWQKDNLPTEFLDDLNIAITDIRKLADDYNTDIAHVKENKKLPSTNIRMLDEMFALFSDRFASHNIFFKLIVSGSIIYMTENIISQKSLETMVGDHLQDALIAVNASDATTGSVMAFIGEAGSYYEFAIHDSGIPFDVDTLVRLGTKRVTTHSKNGGSGVGFMHTFEIMQECNASLIIKEIKPGGAFSKSVTIRFDGNHEYIIETYRDNDFPKNERYTIMNASIK